VKGKIGCPTRIVTPIPYMREMFGGAAKELSKDAKFRLKVPDWYFGNVLNLLLYNEDIPSGRAHIKSYLIIL
jgi:hypothetical protein